jgi:hypothetical protein
MVQFTCLNIQNGLVGQNRSVFYLESSQSDHYWGRYELLQPNGPLMAPLGRKGLIYPIDCQMVVCVAGPMDAHVNQSVYQSVYA